MHPKCSEFMHSFLNLIELDMLLVDSWHRSSCKEIRSRLESLLQMCKESPTFATEPAVWTPKPKEDRPGDRPVEISVSLKYLRRISSRIPEYEGEEPRVTVDPMLQ